MSLSVGDSWIRIDFTKDGFFLINSKFEILN